MRQRSPLNLGSLDECAGLLWKLQRQWNTKPGAEIVAGFTVSQANNLLYAIMCYPHLTEAFRRQVMTFQRDIIICARKKKLPATSAETVIILHHPINKESLCQAPIKN